MSVYKISAALMLCLMLINGIYAGSTAAYVYSLSATCANTFVGESVSEMTTGEQVKETTSIENSTIKSDSVKKSPATGNTAYKYVFVFVMLVSLFLTFFIHKKLRRKSENGREFKCSRN